MPELELRPPTKDDQMAYMGTLRPDDKFMNGTLNIVPVDIIVNSKEKDIHIHTGEGVWSCYGSDFNGAVQLLDASEGYLEVGDLEAAGFEYQVYAAAADESPLELATKEALEVEPYGDLSDQRPPDEVYEKIAKDHGLDVDKFLEHLDFVTSEGRIGKTYALASNHTVEEIQKAVEKEFKIHPEYWNVEEKSFSMYGNCGCHERLMNTNCEKAWDYEIFNPKFVALLDKYGAHVESRDPEGMTIYLS
jgi:hypothetical protein